MASIMIPPKIQFIDGNGNPIVGGLIWTYQAGTDTPKNTYQDHGASILNTNPVVLDADGRASVWLTGAYKIIVTYPGGNPSILSTVIYSADNVISYTDVDFTGLTATIDDLNSTTTTGILVSTNYSIGFTDRGKTILVNAASTPVSINLPPIANVPNKWKVCIKKIDLSANNVTIVTNASELIDGVNDLVLPDYGDFVEVLADGSQWRIVASQFRGSFININASISLNLSHNNKIFFCDLSSGDIAITLPHIASVGRGFTFGVKTGLASGGNKVIVDADAPDLIDGHDVHYIYGDFQFYSFKANSTNWYIIDKSIAGIDHIYTANVVTPNNYNISDLSLDQPSDGTVLKIYVSVINTGAVTLSINSGTAHPIKIRQSSGIELALQGGELSGDYYDIVYNSSDSSWELSTKNFGSLSNISNGTGLVIPRPQDIRDYLKLFIRGTAVYKTRGGLSIHSVTGVVSNVTHESEGFSTIHFSPNMPSSNYGVMVFATEIETDDTSDGMILARNKVPTVSSVQIVTRSHRDDVEAPTADCDLITVLII